MTQAQLRALWAELETELLALTPAFDLKSPSGQAAFASFDAFMSENEFGLALETLCDYLLLPEEPSTPPEILTRIEALHRLMELSDECCRHLRQKAGSA